MKTKTAYESSVVLFSSTCWKSAIYIEECRLVKMLLVRCQVSQSCLLPPTWKRYGTRRTCQQLATDHGVMSLLCSAVAGGAGYKGHWQPYFSMRREIVLMPPLPLDIFSWRHRQVKTSKIYLRTCVLRTLQPAFNGILAYPIYLPHKKILHLICEVHRMQSS